MLKNIKEIDNASTRRFHRHRMTTPDPFSMDISRHIWETRYRAAGEADIHASWRRVAQAIAQAESGERESVGRTLLRACWTVSASCPAAASSPAPAPATG